MADDALGLDELRVGQRFQSRAYVVTSDAIKAYARDWDPQPFHTDEEAAKATFFGGLAASGWHTAAISMRLLTESFRVTGGIIGSGGELLWTKPVRPGDALTVETEILSITPSRSKPGRAAVDIRAVTRNQDGDVVQIFAPKLLVMRVG